MIEPRRRAAPGESAERGGASDAGGLHVASARDRSMARARSIVIREDGDERLRNRSFVIAPDGHVAQRYDKIHMFDVTLAEWRELSRIGGLSSGEAAALAGAAVGRARHDRVLRSALPDLFRALAQGGASFLSVPSAFTVPTGRAHWHVLLRARAIENFCFVFAPAQWASMPKDAAPNGHSSSSRRGARSWRRPRTEPGSSSPRSTRKKSPKRASRCRRSATTGRSRRRAATDLAQNIVTATQRPARSPRRYAGSRRDRAR